MITELTLRDVHTDNSNDDKISEQFNLLTAERLRISMPEFHVLQYIIRQELANDY